MSAVPSFDPFDGHYLADPYPPLSVLTKEAPVFYDAALDYWVVTRHASVERIFKDLETFSADIAQDPLTPVCPRAREALTDFAPSKVLSNSEPQTHSRIRPALNTAFARRVAESEPSIRAHVRQLVADLRHSIAHSGTAEFVSTLSFPLPAATIFSLIGFPSGDTDRLKSWCANRLAFSWGRPSDDEQVLIAKQMVKYWQYCANFTEQCNDERPVVPRHFTHDLVAMHQADSEKLTLQEITSIIYGLSFAGHETTTNLLSNTLRQLLQSGVYEQLVSDPATIPAAVEEALRLDSSVIAWRRRARTAVTIDGVQVPKDARLLLMIAAANHDPALFAEPQRFQLDRPNVRRHLSFGKGAHFCLGAQLARIQVQMVLEQLVAELPTLALGGEPLAFHPNVTFRGPTRLMLTLSA
jgi:cytochrome P450